MQQGMGDKCTRLFDVYEDDEFVHLVMENCSGGTLLQFMHIEPEEG